MASEFQISTYPKDLASFIRDNWPTGKARECASLPDLTVLEHLISICYQASLLQEEGRPVRFRVIFLAPDCFPPDLGPPVGLHRLLFRDKLQFTERELRKLSPSVDFYGSLIGLWLDDKNGLAVWGIVHSGLRWTQSLYGGGKLFQPLPASLVISVTNPGRITVSKDQPILLLSIPGELPIRPLLFLIQNGSGRHSTPWPMRNWQCIRRFERLRQSPGRPSILNSSG